jgi:[ribosomal protein S18]-alanine N-acetyltransferase
MNTTGNFQRESSPSDEVIELDQKFFPHPWTREQWSEMNPDQNHILTWRLKNELIGYGLFHFLSGDDTAHLLKILIVPDHRGSGETKKFWDTLKVYLKNAGQKSIYLEVGANNVRAIHFYEKCGFKLLRRNKAYYSNGEDALAMSMTL